MAKTLPLFGRKTKRKIRRNPTRVASARKITPAIRKANIMKAAVHTGEVAGSTALASAAIGWLQASGKNTMIANKVDYRVAAGTGLLVAGLWNKPNTHLCNAGVGVLGSWVANKAEDLGAGFAKGGDAAVSGYGEDESGLFGLGRKAKERRLQKKQNKLDRIRRKQNKIRAKLGKAALPDIPSAEQAQVRYNKGRRLRAPMHLRRY